MRHEPMGQTVIRYAVGGDSVHAGAHRLSELSRLWWRAGHALIGRVGGNSRATLRVWRERSRERQMIQTLAPKLVPNELRDLGVTRQQILFEANKPFWRA